MLALINFEEDGGSKSSPQDLRGSVISIAKATPVNGRKTPSATLVPELVDGALTSKQLVDAQKSNGKRFRFDGSQESLNYLAPFKAGIGAWRKYLTFYRSPSVKFSWHTVSKNWNILRFIGKH